MAEENKGFEYAKFKGHRCFKNEWAGFEKIRPINVIIGRNNTGKSALLDLVDHLVTTTPQNNSFDIKFCDSFRSDELETRFAPYTPFYRLLEDTDVTWTFHDNEWDFTLDDVLYEQMNEVQLSQGENNIRTILTQKEHALRGKISRRILAERDIGQESADNNILTLGFSGDGATNICRRYITGANERYPRSLIQNKLLIALNHIFGKDADFAELQIQQHDNDSGGVNGHWEIYLHEQSKGLIPLSKSGSGLKTVIMVLLNLLVIPDIEGKEPSDYVFSFEELENNLHPALQRQLFAYIGNFAVEHGCNIFITTHSNVVLDVFVGDANAQILHVEHDGESASVRTVDEFFGQLDVVNDLGAKASDLLQANGIVWLEGPSDRIYFNKWIELFTDGNLKEGMDYQCAFYGGSILGHHSADPNDTERINLLRVNHNAVLLADGDRTAKTGKGSRLKPRVSKIRNEIEKLDSGHVWVTNAKEIESYVPTPTLAAIFDKPKLPSIDQSEPFSTSKGDGFYHKHTKRKTFNKVEFAQQVVPELTLDGLKNTFEWEEQMERIIATIQSWNER